MKNGVILIYQEAVHTPLIKLIVKTDAFRSLYEGMLRRKLRPNPTSLADRQISQSADRSLFRSCFDSDSDLSSRHSEKRLTIAH